MQPQAKTWSQYAEDFIAALRRRTAFTKAAPDTAIAKKLRAKGVLPAEIPQNPVGSNMFALLNHTNPQDQWLTDAVKAYRALTPRDRRKLQALATTELDGDLRAAAAKADAGRIAIFSADPERMAQNLERGREELTEAVREEVTTAPEAPLTLMPAEEQPVEEQPVEEQPVEEQPVEEQPEEQPVEEQPVEEQPVEEQPVEEQPAEEQPVEEQPVEEQPVEEQPVEEQPVEEQPEPTAE